MPFAFALLGLAVLFVQSGIWGQTVADVFGGKPHDPLDPAGAQFTPLQQLGVDPNDLTAVPGNIASGLVDTAKGVGQFEGHTVALWIIPILKYARAHGWHGTVTSGYRTLAEQTRIYNSGVRPAAKPGTSNHESSVFPGGAVDVTEAAQLSSILKASPYSSVLVWAGAKDPVHFSHPHGGSY